MKQTKATVSTVCGWVVRLSSAVALAACSAGAGDEAPTASEALDGTEGPTSSLEEGAALEETLEPELAFEIADAKREELAPEGLVTPELLEKHASCGTNGPTGSSVTNADAPSNGAANQRSGSSTGCVAVGVLQPTDDARYFCFTFANDGFTWTYAQNLRTGVRGWTRDDLLDDFGSFTHCGF